MNNREMLDELDKKVIELEASKKELRSEVIDFEENGEFEKYNAYSDDAKAIMYPNEHKVYLEMEKIDKEAEALSNEATAVATRLNIELGEKIASLESKIQANDNHIKKLEEEIEKLKEAINEKKQTESYKNGDDEVLMEVEDMEEMLKLKVSQKDRKVAEIQSVKSEINKIKEERKELVELYAIKDAEPIVPTENQLSKEHDEQQSEQPNCQKEQGHQSQENNKSQNQINNNTDVPIAGETLPETGEVSDETQKLKLEFQRLSVKAKNGKLTDGEFAKLTEIMSDKSNYDKLDITTGVIFNKSKSIFKALAKHAIKTGPVVKSAREKGIGGIKFETANKKNDYISTVDVGEWRGLKLLADNPDKKITVEEYFKKIVSLDRNSLSEDEQKIYDDANKHLKEFEALRGALATYKDVTSSREKSSKGWFRKKEKTKALPECDEVSESSNIEFEILKLPNDFFEKLEEEVNPPSAEEAQEIPKQPTKTEPEQTIK